MATYADIEKLRTTKRHYVKYDYNKLDPIFDDEYDPTLKICRYPVTNPDNGASKMTIIKSNIAQHDLYNANKSKPSFYQIEDAILEAVVDKKLSDDEYKQIENFTSYIKSLTTINNPNDPTCRSALLACASIDFNALTKDVKAAIGNPQEMARVLQSLTAEVNAVAINGMFSTLFTLVSKVGARSADYTDVDPLLEKQIINIYNRSMFGDNKYDPIQIPTDPTKVFNLLNSLDTTLQQLKKEYAHPSKKMSNNEIVKNIIDPFRITLEKGKSAQNNTQKSVDTELSK